MQTTTLQDINSKNRCYAALILYRSKRKDGIKQRYSLASISAYKLGVTPQYFKTINGCHVELERNGVETGNVMDSKNLNCVWTEAEMLEREENAKTV